MAKNAKKITSLGLHPEDFQETRIRPVQEPVEDSTHTSTHDYTHNHTHTHTDIVELEQKETKTKRVQLLTYESLMNRVDAYAAKRGVKRIAVIEAAIEAYLDKVDPKD